MAKSDEIIIENWQKGIAPHPVFGFSHVRNVDISSYPGIFRLNNVLTKKSSTTVTGNIVGFRINPNSSQQIYAYDTGAKVYKSTDGGTSWSVVAGNSSGTGTGIAIWKDYLLVATTTKLDAYGPLSSSPAWTNNFQSPDSSTTHIMLESVDDKLYICSGRYINQLKELTTFAPGTGATYTWNQHAITLGSGYIATCLADLGSYLMVGTRKSNGYDFKVADIFPYARTDLTLGIPLKLQDNGINSMISVNNRLYVQAGVEGRFFVCDTVSFAEIAKIPNYLINLDGGSFIFTAPEALIFHKGKLFVGISSGSILGNLGVWSIDLQSYKIQFENTISTGNDGATASLYINALCSTNRDVYLCAWFDNVTPSYGIDQMDNQTRFTNYEGFVESPLYHVGESLANRTIGSLEVHLTKPLTTGQGIRIKFRSNLTSAFTTLGTYTFSTEGAVLSFNKPAGTMTGLVFIMIRCELASASSSNLSPEVKRILLKPSL